MARTMHWNASLMVLIGRNRTVGDIRSTGCTWWFSSCLHISLDTGNQKLITPYESNCVISIIVSFSLFLSFKFCVLFVFNFLLNTFILVNKRAMFCIQLQRTIWSLFGSQIFALHCTVLNVMILYD